MESIPVKRRGCAPEKAKTVLCIAIVAVYVLSLLPVFAAARWNVPHNDDRLGAEELFDAYEMTGTLAGVAEQALFMMRRFYHNWQGTFANALLCYVGEFAFAYRHPAVTPVVMLAALTGATALLFGTALRLLGADRRTRWILTLAALFFMVQQLPSAMESFFWFSSALLYTGSWCFACLLFSLLLLAGRTQKTAGQVACALGAAVLAVAVGGGAYPLLPPTLLLLLLALILSLIRKNRPSAWASGVTLAAFLVAAGANVLAPGNRVRMGGGMQTGAVQAILLSIRCAAESLAKRLDPGIVLFVLLAVFLLLPALKKTAFRFRRPWLVCLISLGVYASLFTATLYTTGSIGPGRVQNLYDFAVFPLLLLNAAYWTGAAIQAWPKAGERLDRAALAMARRPVLVLIAAAVLAASSLYLRGPRETTAYAAVYELATGRLQAYSEMRQAELAGAPRDDSVPQSYLIP